MAMTDTEITEAISEGAEAVSGADWSAIKKGIAESSKGRTIRKHIYAEAHAASLVTAAAEKAAEEAAASAASVSASAAQITTNALNISSLEGDVDDISELSDGFRAYTYTNDYYLSVSDGKACLADNSTGKINYTAVYNGLIHPNGTIKIANNCEFSVRYHIVVFESNTTPYEKQTYKTRYTWTEIASGSTASVAAEGDALISLEVYIDDEPQTMTDDYLTALSAGVSIYSHSCPIVETVRGMALELNAKKARDHFIVTEYKNIQYWWLSSGKFLGTTTLYHSQNIPVKPGQTLYYCYDYTGKYAAGAWFDGTGEWIAPLERSDMSEYDYTTATCSRETTDYAKMYTFTVPDGAYYLSLNLPRKPTDAAPDTQYYKCGISTEPVFTLADTGNYSWDDEDALYQAKKNNTMLFFGPSTVAIDRLLKSPTDGYYIDKAGHQVAQNIVGYQEYIFPWYKDIVSFGVHGGALFYYDVGANSMYTEFKTAVDNGTLDLSAFDEFYIAGSTNDVRFSTSWDYDPKDSEGNRLMTSYAGALRYYIETAYDANKFMRIYLSPIQNRSSTTTYVVPDSAATTPKGATVTTASGETFTGTMDAGSGTYEKKYLVRKADGSCDIYITVRTGTSGNYSYYYTHGNTTKIAIDGTEGTYQINISDMVSDIIDDLCEEYGCEKIDPYLQIVADGKGEYSNSNIYRYDGTHANQEGNRVQGMALRKAILGF